MQKSALEKIYSLLTREFPRTGKSQQFADFPMGSVVKGFPCGSAGKESTCNVGDLGSIPGLGRSPGERKGNPL